MFIPHDVLAPIVAQNKCYADVLRCLGAWYGDRTGGGAYRQLKRMISQYELSTSHFDNIGRRANAQHKKKLVRDSVFCRNSQVTGSTLRRYFRKEPIPYICEVCPVTNSWNGKPLTLHVDHNNGVSNDNRIKNLRWLCPNCHSQTETYAGKKQKKSRAKKEQIRHKKADHDKVIDRFLEIRNYEQTGRDFGITGNAVKKIVKNKGIDIGSSYSSRFQPKIIS